MRARVTSIASLGGRGETSVVVAEGPGATPSTDDDARPPMNLTCKSFLPMLLPLLDDQFENRKSDVAAKMPSSTLDLRIRCSVALVHRRRSQPRWRSASLP